jgi:hypothetical protein
MMIALSLISLAFGAAIASSTPATAGAPTAATPSAPAAVHAKATRHRHNDDMVVIERSNEPTDDEVIQDQLRLRVLMPALSGDGGG